MNKTTYKTRRKTAEKLFAAKKEFHESMAKLPFEDKLRKLSKLKEFVTIIKK